MENNTFGAEFVKELEAEEDSTRECLRRIPANLFDFKPHEKSMKMGDVAQTIAEIPKWIVYVLEKGDIDFATYKQPEIKTTEDLVNRFDENIKEAKEKLQKVSDKDLEDMFYLKNGGQILASSSKKESISSNINHMVHHRGQLTVYMRMNNIPIPSIYGPSGDDPSWNI